MLFGIIEDEARAFVILGVEPYRAAKEFDDGLADGETQTPELDVITHLTESIEYVVYLLWWDAHARIRHTGTHHVAILLASQCDHALIRVLHGILEQMAQLVSVSFFIAAKII